MSDELPEKWRAIEKWYSGKSLHAITSIVFPALVEAEALGHWPQRARLSLKVKAALNKQNQAIKFANKHERRRVDERYRGATGDYPDPATLSGLLDDVRPDRSKHYFTDRHTSGHAFVFAMQYGQFMDAPELARLAPTLEPFCTNDAERAALATAAQWAVDFTPIAELIALLDATRPKPTVIMGTLSPTVVKNLGDTLGISFASIRMPEMKSEYRWIDVPMKGGGTKRVRIVWVEILWPEGTRHNCSRFSRGSRAGNNQCEACGHAIKDPWNWLPLLADGPQGPMSLWVGRDCARKLFGVKIDDGVAQYKGRETFKAVP